MSKIVFGPNLSLVQICRQSKSIFDPDMSLVQLWFSVRVCLGSESGFRSEFVYHPNLVSTRNFFWFRIKISVAIWFLVRNLFSVRIWFLLRICLCSESSFQCECFFGPNLVFGPNVVLCPKLSLVRNCVSSEFVLGPKLDLVRICLWSNFVFGQNFSVTLIWFLFQICL